MQKELQVRSLFQGLKNAEEKYQKIIQIGRGSTGVQAKRETDLVPGCQSLVYLTADWDGRLLHFKAESDALISSGLAQLLLTVYSGESPEVILKHPPTYLKDLGILTSLSPGRASGLASMHKRLKELAMGTLIGNHRP